MDYRWARELDPNVKWDPRTRMLTALGRTYKPGEYLLEGGRAYIPDPGYKPVRSFLESLGLQVGYDPKTKMLKLPYGINLPQSSLYTLGGTTYAPLSQLAGAFQVRAAQYKPPEPTAEDVRRKMESLAQVYTPIREAEKGRLELELQKILQAAEQQRRTAEAEWSRAFSELGEQETEELRRQAALVDPYMAAYRRRKVGEAYAKERTGLERDKATQLANIAAQSALAANELAQQGREQEARWASQLAQYAYESLQKGAEEQRKSLQDIANYLADLVQTERETRERAAELAFQRYMFEHPSAAELLRAETERYLHEHPSADALLRAATERAQSKGTLAQRAQDYIAQYQHRFKSARDMYAQVLRNMRAGTIDYALGNTVLGHLRTMYPEQIGEKGAPPKGETLAQKAQSYIKRNQHRFKSAKDMYAQVLENMKAGTVDYALGNAILKQLAALYPEIIIPYLARKGPVPAGGR